MTLKYGATPATQLVTETSALTIRPDRAIKIRSVSCPVCHVPVGEACVSSNGKPVVHSSRRRMAIRAENASYCAADVTFARRLPTYTRRGLREAANLSRRDLAALFNVSDQTIGRWENGKSVPTGPEGAAYGIWMRERLAAQPRPEQG